MARMILSVPCFSLQEYNSSSFELFARPVEATKGPGSYECGGCSTPCAPKCVAEKGSRVIWIFVSPRRQKRHPFRPYWSFLRRFIFSLPPSHFQTVVVAAVAVVVPLMLAEITSLSCSSTSVSWTKKRETRGNELPLTAPANGVCFVGPCWVGVWLVGPIPAPAHSDVDGLHRRGPTQPRRNP